MVKNLRASAGDIRDAGSIPWVVRKIPKARIGSPLSVLAWQKRNLAVGP